MGTVWLAHDTELDRKVALKVLRPALAGDDTAQARLPREARAMAKLRHPNVITVFDAETIGGRDLVAMELVKGENMASWLAGDRSEDEILGGLLAAGRGLAAALRTALAAAPWWLVTWVHSELVDTATTLAAELGALGPTSMVCAVPGGRYSANSPADLALGSDSAPVHCTE